MTRVVQFRMSLPRELLIAIGPDTAGLPSQIVLVTGVMTVILYVCYRTITGDESISGTTGDKMKPEDVKLKTEQWSKEAAINPAYPPGKGPETTHANPGNTRSKAPGDDDHQYRKHSGKGKNSTTSIDPTGMEFAWQKRADVTFDDLGGRDDVKKVLRTEVIRPLENPEKAEELGVTTPNVIFYGPPGTGKTYTAEALATELGVPFVKLSGSDIQSKWINESSTNVNELFEEAKEMAERVGGAVVFLDELDSVLKKRGENGNSHEEDNKVVNEFLNQLEDTKDHNIVFVGATNRIDALDKAGIRSGRIDLKIKIGEPDFEARKAILRAQLADRNHDITEKGIEELALSTDGMVAADLELIVNRAAKNVLTRNGDVIQWTDLVY